MKQTRKKESILDLKPSIHELKLEGDTVSMLVDAGSSVNIKPSMVMEALYREHGETMPEFALLVTRTELYMNAGTDQEKHFVPLRDAGEEV